MPEAALITWAESLGFADMVEEARDEYAKGFCQGGEKKGQPLPGTGLGDPVRVGQFPDLKSFLADLEADSGAEPSEESGDRKKPRYVRQRFRVPRMRRPGKPRSPRRNGTFRMRAYTSPRR